MSRFAFRGRIINSVAHSIKRDTPRIIILINIRRPIRLVLARDCCSIKCEAEVGFKFQIGRPRRKGIVLPLFTHPNRSTPFNDNFRLLKIAKAEEQSFSRVFFHPFFLFESTNRESTPRGGIILFLFLLFFIVFIIVCCAPKDTFSLCHFMNL